MRIILDLLLLSICYSLFIRRLPLYASCPFCVDPMTVDASTLFNTPRARRFSERLVDAAKQSTSSLSRDPDAMEIDSLPSCSPIRPLYEDELSEQRPRKKRTLFQKRRQCKSDVEDQDQDQDQPESTHLRSQQHQPRRRKLRGRQDQEQEQDEDESDDDIFHVIALEQQLRKSGRRRSTSRQSSVSSSTTTSNPTPDQEDPSKVNRRRKLRRPQSTTHLTHKKKTPVDKAPAPLTMGTPAGVVNAKDGRQKRMDTFTQKLNRLTQRPHNDFDLSRHLVLPNQTSVQSDPAEVIVIDDHSSPTSPEGHPQHTLPESTTDTEQDAGVLVKTEQDDEKGEGVLTDLANPISTHHIEQPQPTQDDMDTCMAQGGMVADPAEVIRMDAEHDPREEEQKEQHDPKSNPNMYSLQCSTDQNQETPCSQPQESAQVPHGMPKEQTTANHTADSEPYVFVYSRRIGMEAMDIHA